MSASPVPSRRLNNLNGRSRSPSPAANASLLNAQAQPHASTNNARSNFLSPANPDLIRTRRSAEDPALRQNLVPESIPLIEAENINPPLANPETDDIDDDREVATAPYPGVDDGFFIGDRSNPDGQTVPGTAPENGDADGDDVDGRRVFPARRPMSPGFNGEKQPNFPDLELGSGLGGIPLDLESIPDVNVYQHKKTLAQGMMDLALFSANANQLRYVVESNLHPYYYPGVILISISLILQVAIGVGLIWNSRYNVKDEKEICIANKINNFTVIGIFLVTVVNVFISAFGVASSPAAASTSP